jgi:UDP:flavonoid glycosyltransferase YjiC (YdhE family)
VIFSALKESYEDLFLAVEDADLLITHPAAPAGPLVARKTVTPWISTVLAPMSFLSAYDPPVPPYWPWFNHLSLLGPAVMKAAHSLIKKSFKAQPAVDLRRQLGLEDTGHPMFEGQHSRELVLALFSPIFASAQPDWPRQTRITGFPFYDGHRELEMPEELRRFLDDGQPPIVFTLGSSAVWVARDFFHQSIAAAKHLQQRAVLLIGDERNLPAEPLPEGMIAVNYAPYQSLLPQAGVMVHHGGIGTTSQGLRAGVPTLIVPFAFDQHDNASHAARIGTSRTLYRKDYFAKRVAKELDVLLSTPQYAVKAREVGERLGAEQGTNNACDLIEDFLGTHPRTEPDLEGAYAAGY